MNVQGDRERLYTFIAVCLTPSSLSMHVIVIHLVSTVFLVISGFRIQRDLTPPSGKTIEKKIFVVMIFRSCLQSGFLN